MSAGSAPAASYRLLAERCRAAPALVRSAASQPIPAPPFLPGAARAILVTGVGSSAAHAQLLAHLLADVAGLPARAVPIGAFISRRADPRDALIVFSQGLSPNAQLALHDAAGWLGVMLATAVTRRTHDAAKRAALRRVERAGGRMVTLPGGVERGLLLRVAGPLAGYAVAYRLAAAIADAAGRDATALRLDPAGIAAAMRAAAAVARRLPSDLLDGEVALLASGGYGALAGNLAQSIGEGLYRPAPPLGDLIDFAHGTFQELYDRRATVLALTRRGAPGEADLLRRLRRMLDRRRHRLVALPATLPGAQALFEHQTLVNTLLLRTIAARRLDQARWPGRGRDGALYRVARPAAAAAAGAPAAPPRALAELTWPELAAARRAGCDTAVVPLGATEQHGPHLPFATDTHIADALAERFCARVPEAVRLPALAFGCSAEHAAFPGTVTLRWQTLAGLLGDVVASLARQGFRRVLVFSAHGGNDALLREQAPALRDAARPTQVVVAHGITRFARRWQQASAAAGVSPAAAGQHAGEFETSIMLGLHPATVRRTARGGNPASTADAHALFYPDLRRHAPDGVVGDPRRAASARAAAYLDAWCDLLVADYRRAKKRQTTKGIQKA